MTKPELKYNNSVTVSVIKHNPDYSKLFTWIFLYTLSIISVLIKTVF